MSKTKNVLCLDSLDFEITNDDGDLKIQIVCTSGSLTPTPVQKWELVELAEFIKKFASEHTADDREYNFDHGAGKNSFLNKERGYRDHAIKLAEAEMALVNRPLK